ncbi:hypothetical protein ACNHKD_11275 [Methylocystis sp. JAN1]|uniref:hypothetical protein n=1 Tax=Methylocystis sp. JAN1 TaxID=3397211 RepID=UPI003FA2DDC8
MSGFETSRIIEAGLRATMSSNLVYAHVFRRVRRLAPLALAAFIFSSAACRAADEALRQLLVENCRLAEAIVKGRILSSETAPRDLTRTRFAVTSSLRGPFKSGEVVDYFSLLESGARRGQEFDNEVVVFLKSRRAAGETRWGLATDFSEFASFRLTGKALDRCLRAK